MSARARQFATAIVTVFGGTVGTVGTISTR